MGADAFTGTVWQDPIIEAPAPARVRSARVTFEPGARTAWHTHPLGQTLYVIAGNGRVQTCGRPGARNPRRRRGLDSAGREALAWRRARRTAMVHVAMQEALDGKHVDWLEHVTDEQYAGA